jgi:hypothetical protein
MNLPVQIGRAFLFKVVGDSAPIKSQQPQGNYRLKEPDLKRDVF